MGAPKINESVGHARVYDYDSDVGAWVQRGGSLTSQQFFDNFGEEVSLSGDGQRLAVGAPKSESEGKHIVDNGRAQTFEWDKESGTWVDLGGPIDGLSVKDEFGSSVSLSKNGMCLAVGGPRHQAAASSSHEYLKGHVRIFEFVCNVHCSESPSVSPSSSPSISTKPSSSPSGSPTSSPSDSQSSSPSASSSVANSALPTVVNIPKSVVSSSATDIRGGKGLFTSWALSSSMMMMLAAFILV